ncbi:MAG: hypothetical protein H0X03_05740 [Nitrosopumilus sp.]|nr:hypothetical protein [Nitrosopumilus sp.]
MFELIFYKNKKEIQKNGDKNHVINQNLQEIISTIEEFSDEQREIIERFKREMEIFTTERSLESCLQALNSSMQLANIREKLLEVYKQYSFLLENEIKKLIEEREKKV